MATQTFDITIVYYYIIQCSPPTVHLVILSREFTSIKAVDKT